MRGAGRDERAGKAETNPETAAAERCRDVRHTASHAAGHTVRATVRARVSDRVGSRRGRLARWTAERLAARLDATTWPIAAQILLFGGAISLYLVGFVLLFAEVGVNVGVAAALPVIAAAWIWGLRAGTLTLLASMGLNTLLFNFHSSAGWDIALRLNQSPGLFVGLMVALLTGSLSDARRRVQAQALSLALSKRALEGQIAEREVIEEGLVRAHREQEQAARSLSLLVSALEDLAGLPGRQAVLEALPELLHRFGEGHASVWLPRRHRLALVAARGFDGVRLASLPFSGVVGRAYREGRVIYVADVSREPAYVALGDDRLGSELALPLTERGEIVAVLNLERPQPFSELEREGFVRFAQAVSQILNTQAERSDALLLAELTQTGAAESLQGALEQALALVVPALQARGGSILAYRGGRFGALAVYGDEDARWLESVGESDPALWQVYTRAEAVFIDGACGEDDEGGLEPALAVQPVGAGSRARSLLVVRADAQRVWSRGEARLLGTVSRALSLVMAQFGSAERLSTLMHLEHDLLYTAQDSMYEQLLEAAVRLVPGAEAGSLLLREGEGARYKAVLGFAAESLTQVSLSMKQLRVWYGKSDEAWYGGEPRIKSVGQESIVAISQRLTDERQAEVLRSSGRLGELQAVLTLPVVYRGEVLAVLNLDSLSDPGAFGEDSLHAVRVFTPPLAFMLHEARQRQLLEEAALTDSLTGLPNRRAFDHGLEHELVRAQRYGQALSLLVMDLRGFKRVNDAFGHAAGDQALATIARALRGVQREGDRFFRWGGDEFAAILPHTSYESALLAAQRYAAAIAKVTVGGGCLGVNIGAASYPADGLAADSLLKVADRRMYDAKTRGLAFVAAAP